MCEQSENRDKTAKRRANLLREMFMEKRDVIFRLLKDALNGDDTSKVSRKDINCKHACTNIVEVERKFALNEK